MPDSTESPDPTVNPLYGATPSSRTESPLSASSAQPETSSRTRPSPETSDPLHGPTPGPVGEDVQNTAHSISDRIDDYKGPMYDNKMSRRRVCVNSSSRSSLPDFLRRLTHLLSILLGASSAVAAVWSVFLLPLFHASFSARRALVTQQSDRMMKLVEGLRKIKANSLYASLSIEKGQTRTEKTREPTKASVKEIHSSDVSTSSQTPEIDDVARTKIIHLSGLSVISRHLRSLTSALDSTSTTRTSVISTLESYTSSLHRHLFVTRPTGSGFAGYSVGLGSLGANLKNEGEPQNRGEDWDAVRKEVRAIKGMLLSGRPVAPGVG